MRFTISAPDLTPPTYETFDNYVRKRFKKLKKFLKKDKKVDHEIRISVRKANHHYEMVSEIFIPEHIVITSKDRDIRRIVDISVDQMKAKMLKEHDKRVDRSRFSKPFSVLSDFANKIRRRDNSSIT